MIWFSRQRAGATAAFALIVAVTLAARIWFGDVPLFRGVHIDLAVMSLAMASMARGARFGTIAGFLLGLIVDSVSPEWMGASAAGFALVGFFAGSFGQTIYIDKTRARAVLVAASMIIFDLVFGLLSVGLASPLIARALASLGSTVVTAGCAALLSRAWQLVLSPGSGRSELSADA